MVYHKNYNFNVNEDSLSCDLTKFMRQFKQAHCNIVQLKNLAYIVQYMYVHSMRNGDRVDWQPSLHVVRLGQLCPGWIILATIQVQV